MIENRKNRLGSLRLRRAIAPRESRLVLEAIGWLLVFMKRHAQDVTRSGDDRVDAMFDGLQAIHAGKSNQAIARGEQDGVAQAGGDAATIGLFALGIIAEDELA